MNIFFDPMVTLELGVILATLFYILRLIQTEIDGKKRSGKLHSLAPLFEVGSLISQPKRSLKIQRW